MLYDHKRWDKPEVKTDPFSLDSLIAWLEKQPEAKRYCYLCTGVCLLSQYFTAMGFKRVGMASTFFLHGDNWNCRADLPPHFNNIALGYPRTFGKALARARRLQHAGVV